MSDELIYVPQVAFRGARTYVHSTTLYDHFTLGARKHGLAIRGPIDMRVSRLIRKQPQFLFVSGPDSVGHTEPAVMTFRVGDAEWRCLISERSEAVERREDYDEVQIRDRSVLDGKTIRMNGHVNAKPFEVVTSLTLQLHHALLRIPADRKWFLARIQFERPLRDEDASEIQIALAKKSVTGLTRCTINAGPDPIGRIDFMLGNLA